MARNLTKYDLCDIIEGVSSTLRVPSDASPTASTLGANAVRAVQEYAAFEHISQAPVIPGESSAPFLSNSDMNLLRASSFDGQESLLIKFFEPFLRKLMNDVSDDIGHEVILLNSERHAWVACPNGRAPSKPDGLGVSPALAQFRLSKTDATFQNRGDGNFGKLARWVLRDSIDRCMHFALDLSTLL